MRFRWSVLQRRVRLVILLWSNRPVLLRWHRRVWNLRLGISVFNWSPRSMNTHQALLSLQRLRSMCMLCIRTLGHISRGRNRHLLSMRTLGHITRDRSMTLLRKRTLRHISRDRGTLRRCILLWCRNMMRYKALSLSIRSRYHSKWIVKRGNRRWRWNNWRRSSGFFRWGYWSSTVCYGRLVKRILSLLMRNWS